MMTTILPILFGIGALILVGLSLLARRPALRVPAFSDLVGFVMTYRVGRVPVGRIALLGFWWWVGWHIFAR